MYRLLFIPALKGGAIPESGGYPKERGKEGDKARDMGWTKGRSSLIIDNIKYYYGSV